MLLPIVWLVALMGVVSIVVGAMRLSDPTKQAHAIATKEQRKKASDLDLKKAKSSGIALLVIGAVMVGLGVYVQFFMK